MFNERIQQIILKTHRRVFPFPTGWMQPSEPDAGKLIENRLNRAQSCLIARFGSIELEAIMAYLYRDRPMSPWRRLYHFASWDVRYRGWQAPLKKKLFNNAGVFPAEPPTLNRFAELYLKIIPEIDILGSWVHAETLLKERMKTTQKIPLASLEPYLSPTPWSQALADQRVLVIHPFTQSIRAQYAKRERLFSNETVLPKFELLTLKAIQSAGVRPPAFASWFDALQFMKDEVSRIDFDIALIGAGAYGLPLAAHVKKLGKKAVHLGGATQMLFGIYGRRWIRDPQRAPLINPHWTRPMRSERPPNASRIENGCYW